MSEPNPRPAVLSQSSESPYRDWVLRGLVGLLIVASATLVWWSFKRLAPVQARSRELNAAVARLSGDLDLMSHKFSKEDVEKIMDRYGQAYGLLFVGQEPIDQWLASLREQMIPLALDGKAELGKAGSPSASDHDLSVIPATVSVEVQPAKGIETLKTPYQRLLQLTRRIGNQDKRVDLVELNVSGGSNSVTRAVAVLDIWSGQERKEVN